MNRKRVSQCNRCTLLLLLLSMPVLGMAKKKTAPDSDLTNILRPTLMNAQTDPTLRFPVMDTGGSVFSITYGWLDITNSSVRYTVAQPLNKSGHSFNFNRFTISELRLSREWLTFRASKKGVMLIYLPPERWGSVHSGPGMSSAAARNSLGTSSIFKTLMNFDGVMALVRPPAPPPAPVIAQPVAPTPPPAPVKPASPPAIVLSSPEGVADRQTIEASDPTLVIRGVAMDSTGIPVVNINGSPANMRPQTTQAAQFWSDPVTLKVGDNPIQIVASNSAHLEASVRFTVHYKPKEAQADPKALDRLEIVGLLQGGVSPERVIDLVKQRGIKFSPNNDDLTEIRAAGGTDDLIQAIQNAAPHP